MKDKPSPPPITAQSPILFSTGQLASTPGALNLLERHGITPFQLIARHIRGDWGAVSLDDATANNDAIQGGRILSSYQVGDEIIWIITEWDRSVTTILLPSEY
jgi:hypothetical protein